MDWDTFVDEQTPKSELKPQPAPVTARALSWDDVSGQDGEKVLSQYQRLDQARNVWAPAKLASQKELFGVTVGDIAGKLGGGLLPGGSYDQTENYKKARAAFDKNDGSVTDEQIGQIAEYELMQQREASDSTSRSIARGAARLPGMGLEVLAGGGAAKIGLAGAARLGIPGAAALATPAASFLGQQGQRAAMGAAITPLTPSLYVEDAQRRSMENGGEWTDAKNILPALGVAGIKNVILGTVGGQVGGIRGGLGARVVGGAAVGTVENQIADAVLGAVDDATGAKVWKAKTGYGVIGDMVAGKQGEVWKHLAGDMLAFGAFAGMHGKDAAGIPKGFQEAIDSAKEAGLSEKATQEKVQEYLDSVKPSEKPTEASDNQQEAIKSPETAPDEPTGKTPTEPEIEAPAKPQEAGEDNYYRVPDYKGTGGDNLEALRRELIGPSFAQKYFWVGREQAEQAWPKGKFQIEFDKAKHVGEDNVADVADRVATLGGKAPMYLHPAMKAIRYKGPEGSESYQEASRLVEMYNEERAKAGVDPIHLEGEKPTGEAKQLLEGAHPDQKEQDHAVRELVRSGGSPAAAEEIVRRGQEAANDEARARAGQTADSSETPPAEAARGAPAEGDQAGSAQAGNAPVPEPAGGKGQPPVKKAKENTKLWKYADRLEKEAAKELKAKFGDVLFSGFDPTAIAPLAKYTAAKIIKGGLTFAEFSQRAVARFGDAIKPHLEEIWAKAQAQTKRPTKAEESQAIKNESTDKLREERGIPAAEEVDPVGHTFPELRDQVAAAVKADPERPARLVEELAKKSRPISDFEDALLLHRQVELDNQYEAASRGIDEAVRSGDPAKIAESRLAEAGIRDKLAEALNVSREVGTQSGRALNARKMLVNKDFSLARMVATRESIKGEKLTETERDQIAAAHAKIKDLQEKLDIAQAAARRKGVPDLKVVKNEPSVRTSKAKAEVDAAWDNLRKLTAGKLFSTPLDPALIGAAARLTKAYAKLGIAKFADLVQAVAEKSGKPLSSEAESVLRAGWERARVDLETEAKGKSDARSKAYYEKKIAEVQAKLEAGDFATEEKKAVDRSPDVMKLRTELAKLQREWKEGNAQLEAKDRPTAQKVMGVVAKWRRGFVLSSPITLAKLTSAAVERTVFQPMQNLVGRGVGLALPKLAAKAVYEGGFNAKIEAKAFTEGWMRWMKDARDVMKTGDMDIGHLYGNRPFDVDPSMADWFGRLHYALKTPAKRAAFERAMRQGSEAAIKAGLDITDPLVQERLGAEAYKYGERSIFQQDNAVVSMWKRATSYSPTTKFIGDMALPIVRVPTNIVAETFNHIFGSAVAPARLLTKGVNKLTPEQADSVMRQFKQGFTGLGLLALGFYLKNDIGGYYDQNDKRKEGDVKFGEIRMFGKRIPSYLVHNPLLECLQVGATMARAAEKRIGGSPQGIGVGAAKALLGLAEETPFMREAVDVRKLAEGQYQSAVGGQVRGLLVPQGIQWAAGNIDKKTPFNPLEDPREVQASHKEGFWRGVGQEVQKGVPFLRNRLAPRAK